MVMSLVPNQSKSTYVCSQHVGVIGRFTNGVNLQRAYYLECGMLEQNTYAHTQVEPIIYDTTHK